MRERGTAAPSLGLLGNVLLGGSWKRQAGEMVERWERPEGRRRRRRWRRRTRTSRVGEMSDGPLSSHLALLTLFIQRFLVLCDFTLRLICFINRPLFVPPPSSSSLLSPSAQPTSPLCPYANYCVLFSIASFYEGLGTPPCIASLQQAPSNYRPHQPMTTDSAHMSFPAWPARSCPAVPCDPSARSQPPCDFSAAASRHLLRLILYSRKHLSISSFST